MPKRNQRFRLECRVAKAGERDAEIMIYSSIAPYRWGDDDPTVTSRDFDRELKALGDVDEITIRINSPGGAVSEAVAIRTALMKHKANKTVDIEGSCCSAATLIACLPGARVRMAKGSDYMIHRCSWVAWGNADAMLSAYQSMINTDNDIADIYAERTGKTREECLSLMTATTWYTAESAIEAGFVDEVISAGEEAGEEPIAACALDADVYGLMKECYQNVPDHPVRGTVSHEQTAVAAGTSTENTGETQQEREDTMDKIHATAEDAQQETREADIAKAAVTAERNRIKAIRALTPKGAKWAGMAEEAIERGDSEADFLRAIIAEQKKTGEEYLESRREETKSADKIGAGDTGDLDSSAKDAEDRAAKEIAEIAATMSSSANVEMA